MKIIWTNPAISGLDKAIYYTELNFSSNKIEFKKTIENTQKQIAKFPFSGNIIDLKESIFRIVFSHFPFCLTYKVKKNNIYILSFMHQNQDW